MKVEHLAWHETLDMHELVAFQANALILLKKNIGQVKDNELRELYRFSIHVLECNLKELLRFYPQEQKISSGKYKEDDTAFYAGNLLGLAKTAVRSYAIAITETATPVLRKVLAKQLMDAIQWHGKVFYFMFNRGFYPSYDLNQLLQTDVMNATKALEMPY